MDADNMDIDPAPLNTHAQPRAAQASTTASPSPAALPLRAFPGMSSQMNVDLAAASTTTQPLRATGKKTKCAFAKPTARQQCDLMSKTNDDIKVRIFSYMPAQSVARICRSTCQELYNFITGHEEKVSDAIAKREVARTKAHSDYIKSFGMPKTLGAFVQGLRCYTRQRGILTRLSLMNQSLWERTGHILRNEWVHAADWYNGDWRHEGYLDTREKLTVLAVDLVQLQLNFRRKGGSEQQRENFASKDFGLNFVGSIELEELYDRIQSSPVDQPFFPGKVYKSPETTAPQTWPDIRLTMAYTGRKAHHPTLPYELVHHSALPKLPQDKTFFYYVEEQWARKAICAGSLRGLKRAAVLELVKIF